MRLIIEARRRLRKAPPLATVWLDTLEAAALAETRDVQALTKLDRAEAGLDAAARAEPTWPWIFRFDAPKLAGYRAVAAARLGRLQTADESFGLATAFEQAPKQRALMDVEHARTLAASGDVAHACKIAVSAFDTGRQLSSERVVHAVGSFRAGLGNRAGRAVEELDQRLHATYVEDL